MTVRTSPWLPFTALLAGAALVALLPAGSATPAPGRCLARPGPVSVPAPPGEVATGESDAGRPFSIDRTEVTVARFRAFVAATGYTTRAEREGWSFVFRPPGDDAAPGAPPWAMVKGADWRHPRGPGAAAASPEEPVTQVTYADALAFARWAGRDLPTAAEWERAARGGDQAPATSLKWAFDASGKPLANTWQGLFPYSDTKEDGFAGVAPVGCFPPNRSGLYDMVGNVWELSRAADGSAVLKGGSYLCSFNGCANFRPSATVGQDRDSGAPHVGFRTIRRL